MNARPLILGVILDAAAVAESDGTFLNYDRRLQQFAAAIEPPGETRATLAVLAKLIERLGGEPVPGEARAVFRLMAQDNGAFAGLGFEQIGPLGVSLATVEVA